MLSRGLSYVESAFRRQDVCSPESLALIELFEVSVTDLVTELCQWFSLFIRELTLCPESAES